MCVCVCVWGGGGGGGGELDLCCVFVILQLCLQIGTDLYQIYNRIRSKTIVGSAYFNQNKKGQTVIQNLEASLLIWPGINQLILDYFYQF